MNLAKRPCPHCNRVTEQNRLDRIPAVPVRGLEFAQAEQAAGLVLVAWLCLVCLKGNGCLYAPAADIIDLRAAIKNA